MINAKLMLLLSLLFISTISYAAFPLESADPSNAAVAVHYPRRVNQASPKVYKHDKHGKQKIFGILAFACAVTVVLAPLAIVFGAIGSSNNRGAHIFAGLGLGIGVLELVAFIPVLILLFLLL